MTSDLRDILGFSPMEKLIAAPSRGEIMASRAARHREAGAPQTY